MPSLNDLIQTLELGPWKGAISSLVLPPAPLVIMVLIGAVMLRRKRLALGWTLIWVACLGLWFGSTTMLANVLTMALVKPPPALSSGAVADLKAVAPAQKTAIVVLGAGREAFAPEYGLSNLTGLSMERLRYGIWLGRATGLPVAFSGGIGHGMPAGASEAEIATRIAATEFGRPLKWAESRSRDTGENAQFTVSLLREAGIERIVIVTHGFHMRRSIGAFQRAIARQGAAISLVPAPIDTAARSYGWLPTADGAFRVRMALREWLGILAGA